MKNVVIPLNLRNGLILKQNSQASQMLDINLSISATWKLLIPVKQDK